jgi:hypothetical protein
MEDLFKMCRDKEIEPVIHDTYSFDEVMTMKISIVYLGSLEDNF